MEIYYGLFIVKKVLDENVTEGSFNPVLPIGFCSKISHLKSKKMGDMVVSKSSISQCCLGRANAFKRYW